MQYIKFLYTNIIAGVVFVSKFWNFDVLGGESFCLVMDQEEGKLPGRFDPGTSVKNPRILGNGVVSEAVNLVNSEERDTVCNCNENKGLEVLGGDLGLSEVQIKGHEQVLDRKNVV